jgi:predicted dehydrogenase
VLKGAFIGFGNVAANGHLPGWRARDDVRIVAATDAAVSRREAFLDACPDGRWYETVDDLLSTKLDFVDICAPPGSHAALIERALEAGLHVLSEKPLVTRVEDAKRMAGAAARAGRVLHTVHNWLKAPICRKVSVLVADGAIRPLADAENATGDRRQRGRGYKLARRSGDGWRRHPVRSWLARPLLRHALGRRSCWRYRAA